MSCKDDSCGCAEKLDQLKADMQTIKADMVDMATKADLVGMEARIVNAMSALLVENGVHPQPVLATGLAGSAATTSTPATTSAQGPAAPQASAASTLYEPASTPSSTSSSSKLGKQSSNC